MGEPPILSKPIPGEPLYLYLVVSEGALIVFLICDQEKGEQPIYYISKRLADAEIRYSDMEKLALALVVSS